MKIHSDNSGTVVKLAYPLPYHEELLSDDSIVDFAHSFITWENNDSLYGRFNVEASCKIFNTKKECIDEYYLLSEVMACSVLQGETMIHNEPVYIFQAAFSDSNYKIFRVSHGRKPTTDSEGINVEGFKRVELSIKRTPATRLSNEQVASIILDNKIASGKCLFSMGNDDSLTYLIEFPVKHINVKTDVPHFQVETGTVLMPAPGGRFVPAFIAFNHSGNFDFITLGDDKKSPRLFDTVYRHKALIKLYSYEY